MAAESKAETAAELEAKLTGYYQNLAEVEAVLAADPANAGATELRNDLNEMIQMTAQLLVMRKAQEAGVGAAAPLPPTSTPAPKSSSAPPSADDQFKMGSRVEVYSNGIYYPAEIRDKMPDGSLSVHYLGFSKDDIITDMKVLRVLRAPMDAIPSDKIESGMKVRAKYIADGSWYKATVKEVLGDYYTVKFDGYDTTENVPYEYLRFATTKITGLEDTSKGFVVPDHLRINPDDSEAVVARKKKRIKAIKNQFRHKKKDDESNQKQASWKSFQNKKKRKLTGFVSSIKKKSMFVSPEGLDGKVGVIGSGRGMTEFSERKKFSDLKKAQ